MPATWPFAPVVFDFTPDDNDDDDDDAVTVRARSSHAHNCPLFPSHTYPSVLARGVLALATLVYVHANTLARLLSLTPLFTHVHALKKVPPRVGCSQVLMIPSKSVTAMNYIEVPDPLAIVRVFHGLPLSSK